jgi:hypothetical protein
VTIVARNRQYSSMSGATFLRPMTSWLGLCDQNCFLVRERCYVIHVGHFSGMRFPRCEQHPQQTPEQKVTTCTVILLRTVRRAAGFLESIPQCVQGMCTFPFQPVRHSTLSGFLPVMVSNAKAHQVRVKGTVGNARTTLDGMTIVLTGSRREYSPGTRIHRKCPRLWVWFMRR